MNEEDFNTMLAVYSAEVGSYEPEWFEVGPEEEADDSDEHPELAAREAWSFLTR